MNRLSTSEYNAYFQPYIDKVNKYESLVEGFKQHLESVATFYHSIPEEKYDYVYAEGKWTVKDVLLHIIDTERILAYRALRIARGDKTSLAGFEQDGYVVHGFAKSRSMESLIEEYKAVRQATITLFNSLTEDNLLFIGEASGFPISVRALGYIILGHENHHNLIIKERYL